jgi:hypothetical protein
LPEAEGQGVSQKVEKVLDCLTEEYQRHLADKDEQIAALQMEIAQLEKASQPSPAFSGANQRPYPWETYEYDNNYEGNNPTFGLPSQPQKAIRGEHNLSTLHNQAPNQFLSQGPEGALFLRANTAHMLLLYESRKEPGASQISQLADHSDFWFPHFWCSRGCTHRRRLR